jgi:hypothetical protein
VVVEVGLGEQLARGFLGCSGKGISACQLGQRVVEGKWERIKDGIEFDTRLIPNKEK